MPKPLTTRPVTEDNAVEMLNREIIPKIREMSPGTAITGSRGGATVDVLRQVLDVLSKAGIITDRTTP